MNGPIETLEALALLVFFALAMIGVGTFVGLIVCSVGTAPTPPGRRRTPLPRR